MKLIEGISPVVSLAIFDRMVSYQHCHRDEQRIQVVVRDPATNDTHPNVVSVPTARVPHAVFDALVRNVDMDGAHGSTALCSSQLCDSKIEGGHDPVIFTVKSILAQKLGAGDALESGILTFQARVGALASGESHYGDGRMPSMERIAMVTIAVFVTGGADQFPFRTASYSHLEWVAIERFVNAVREKDPSILNLDPFQLCIHGLCVSSSYDIIASERGLQSFAALRDLAEG